MKIANKYNPATMPESKDEALRLAEEREKWAQTARENDLPGSAKEFELTALLLRYFAERSQP